MTSLKRINPSVPVVLVLMTLTTTLRVINVSGSPIRLDDEGTYVAQAFAMTEWGELAHYTYWYDHPPGGWLQLALWTTLTGPGFGDNAVVAGRYLMIVVAAVVAGLLWLLSRRVGLTRWAAAAAVLIWAVSPLAISLSRSVYLDNLAIAWLLGGLVLVCSPSRRLSAMVGAALCFGVAVLTKETMLLFLPMVAWVVALKTSQTTRRYALAVFVAVFGLVVSTYVLMAVVRGELLPGPGHVSLWDGVKFQLWQREASGSITDPGSLKRHTIDEWLRLDPLLPLLAAPIAVTALLVQRLRPYALGLLILVIMVLRPGYLPVPFVVAMLPLTALLAAGIGENVIRWVSKARTRTRAGRGHARFAWGLAPVFAAAMVVTLWLPSLGALLTTDEDASMRQAQQWITANVPHHDRLIVDDAMWVDLVRDGRDRHNVTWSYKVDTDEQVQSLAPDGWADYGWIVSTPSMRANMPDEGVLTDAMSHADPVATFGDGGSRVDVLRVGSGESASNGVAPAVPGAGVQVAARLDPASDPDATALLQTGIVDQRVVATLAVLASTQPVVLQEISAVAEEEELAGTPRRAFRVTGPHDRLEQIAGFLDRQQRPFDTESVAITDRGLSVRFPAHATDVGLSTNPGPAGAPATVRVADMRLHRNSDRLEFVRIDGTPAGSLRPDSGNPSDYRAMPAGTYVMTTVADRGGPPLMRQAFTLAPGQTYTLALFSAGETGEVAAQLAPDGPPPGTAMRLVNAAAAAGQVKLELATAGSPIVLADNASYGLITGYGTQPAGTYDAVVTAHGRQWRHKVELADGAPTTLILTDGPDGPALRQTVDVAPVATPLDPPALTLPVDPPAPHKEPAKFEAPNDLRQRLFPVVTCAALIGAIAWSLMKYQRRQDR